MRFVGRGSVGNESQRVEDLCFDIFWMRGGELFHGVLVVQRASAIRDGGGVGVNEGKSVDELAFAMNWRSRSVADLDWSANWSCCWARGMVAGERGGSQSSWK